MAAKTVETFFESQDFMDPPSKRKKSMVEKQKLIKKKRRSSGSNRWLDTY